MHGVVLWVGGVPIKHCAFCYFFYLFTFFIFAILLYFLLNLNDQIRVPLGNPLSYLFLICFEDLVMRFFFFVP